MRIRILYWNLDQDPKPNTDPDQDTGLDC